MAFLNYTALWCSGLTCRPVTAEIDGSNPFRVANLLQSSLRAKQVKLLFAKRLARSVQMLGALSTVAEAYYRYVEQRSTGGDDADERLLTDHTPR